MKIPFRSKRALSMVELVVTMVLLVIVVISAFSLYAYISTFSVKADNYAAATEFLCQTLETLSNCSYNDDALSALPAVNPHPNALPDNIALPVCNLRDKYGGTRSYTVSEALWDATYPDSLYKTITVTINWNDGANRTLTLSMRKTK